MSKLKIYKASAGSGKTHTLTEEYLKLAAKFPDNFKRILAVTFTNKAAEEMKQRILESLNDIINKGKEASFFNVFAENNTKANEKEHINSAKILRDSILHDYSYFSLSTIDSFVQRVIKSFTYEIGIESGYRIELDTEKVLKDLTELLYKQIDNDDNLRTWLIHFANYKMDEGQSWDFRSEINKLAKEIFKEQFQSFDEDEKESDFEYIRNYFELLQELKREFETSMADLGNQALNALSKHNFEFDELGRNIGYIVKYFTISLIEPENHESFVPNTTTLKMLDNEQSWCAKTAKADVKQAASILYNLLNPLFSRAVDLINTKYKFYLSAINILSGFHAFGILRKLSILLPHYRADNNLLLISDTTRILKEIISGNDAPFIYEKIGNRYRHVLIDEFQDTSGFQWENFKPLVKNSLSEGNENLIVGDIKQSIYRWRGGDWNILMSKIDSDIGNEYINHQNLETNWRSKKNILDFNNAVFKSIADLMQKLFDSDLNEGLGENVENEFKSVITRAYTDVCQKLPLEQAKNGGRVKIRFFKKEKGDKKSDIQERINIELPETIQQLLSSKNYQPGDIAILVRRNTEGKQVANILLDYQQLNPEAVPYQVISSESLMLINSPVVKVLINAMYYILDQNDKIHLHALIVANSIIIDQQVDFNHEHFNNPDKEAIEKKLPFEFVSSLENFKKLNVYELSERLCTIFKLNRLNGQLAYLQSFQDILLEFGRNESVDLASFLDWWSEKGNNFAVQLADQKDAVKIVTIHKSKGLAFRIVIIPYCDWEIVPRTAFSNIIWTSSDIEPFNRFKRFPIVYRKYLNKSIFWKEYYEELLYAMIDALNMLYVAFTRPKEELIIFAPSDESKDKQPLTVADLLYSAIRKTLKADNLVDLQENFDPESNIYELKKDYKDIDDKKFVKETVVKSTFLISEFAESDWSSKINIIKHSGDFFKESIEYIKAQIDYGTLMHEIFSRIDNIKNTENILDELYFAGKIDSQNRKELTLKIKEMLRKPEVADWFSDRWEVKTEQAILDTTGKIRIPDRVLFGKDETVVIDFKFGERYLESVNQVSEYMDLLAEMGYPLVKGFIYYAEKDIIEEVA
jgi:ATP-dependent exoDNAse (exonuclease V) beta subunit